MDEDRKEYVTEVRDENTTVDGGDTAVHREVKTAGRTVGGNVIAARVVYYLAGIVIALLALRIVLLLLAANPSSPFVNFIYNLSGVFAWPFYGVFGYQPSYGSSTLELSSVLAIVIYSLVAYGLAKLFTLVSGRSDV